MAKLTIVLLALLMVGAIACSGSGEESKDSLALEPVEDPMVWAEPNAIAALADYLYEQDREIFEIVVHDLRVFYENVQKGTLIKLPPEHPPTTAWIASPHIGDSWTVTTEVDVWRVYEGGQHPILVGALPPSDS